MDILLPVHMMVEVHDAEHRALVEHCLDVGLDHSLLNSFWLMLN